MTQKQQAFLFDLNGTIIDDMAFHGRAWYQILTVDLGAKLTHEEVKVQMYGKNGEVLDRIFGKNRFSEEDVEKWSMEKERRYQKEYLPHIKLIDGLDDLLKRAAEHSVQLAVASAAIPFNIDFALDNLNIRHYFGAIVSANDVAISKPHPETFLKAAQLLGASPENCIVFEDAPKGVEAAQNAGMKCVAITTAHPKEDFSQYTNVLAFVKDYTDPFIKSLL
ncbi:HAD family phosphatase [Rhodocytophaga rosea]|uniref:HAD family phosphatase n=1 Tax=Rhodocytophaga rosea TaxID=2704465 RepID=A0A6C0GNT4_9BACT|nr:HAD family phosphatase [Rhodocytophaga rosea]QHT69695.1 HAD family phosphatase [Rhodocytophaga rosea]